MFDEVVGAGMVVLGFVSLLGVVAATYDWKGDA